MKLKNRIWIWKKRSEINKQIRAIEAQFAIFNMRSSYGYGGTGTKDINMIRMYKLKGNGRVSMGSSVDTLNRLRDSLCRAIEVLDRFEIRGMKNEVRYRRN